MGIGRPSTLSLREGLWPERDDAIDLDVPCETCRLILLWLSGGVAGGVRVPTALGSLNELLDSSCPDHPRLAQHIKDEVMWRKTYPSECSERSSHDDESPVGSRTLYISPIHPRMPSPPLMVLTKQLNSRHIRDFFPSLLIQKPGRDCGSRLARDLDPEWLNPRLLADWKTACVSSHEECRNPLRLESVQPAWLIDTHRSCLVPGRSCLSGEGYVCLSYRWGITRGSLVNHEDLSRIQLEGSLSDPELAPLIPPIVERAIHLVKGMGERYLWADALCIVRGDQMVSSQLLLMGEIFSSAIFTITALEGDALSGLPGVDCSTIASLPRDLGRDVFPIGNGELLTFQEQHHTPGVDGAAEYHSRGWTFQEFELSARKLIIDSTTASWACNRCELLEFSEQVNRPLSRPRSFQVPIPDSEALNTDLARFNRCDLTYEEDAFAAISGFLLIASRTWPGGFLYGLPEMCFDMAIAWFPSPFGLKAREVSAVHQSTLPIASGLPSWSWIGWKGSFQWTEEDGLYRSYFRPRNKTPESGEDTVAITTWYTSDKPQGATKRPIDSWWFDERNRARAERDGPLPRGWTRTEAPLLDDASILVTAFSHDDAPAWWYPYPIPGTSATPTEPHLPSQTAYVMCQTHRAWLYASQATDDPPKRWPGVVQLRDDSRQAVGLMYLNNKSEASLFPSHDTTAPLRIELVAIRRRKRPAIAKSWRVQDRTTTESRSLYDDTEVYDLLWVEWNDGVAYRKAIAVVEKSCWEKQLVDPISLVLG